jgi:hypothetical protein
MKTETADAAIAASLRGMAKLLRQADRLARRSIVAAGARDRDKALQIALDVKPLLHETMCCSRERRSSGGGDRRRRKARQIAITGCLRKVR